MTTEEKSLGRVAYEKHISRANAPAWQVSWQYLTPQGVDDWCAVAKAVTDEYVKRNPTPVLRETTPEPLTLGQIAYEKHRQVRRAMSPQFAPVPDWEGVPPAERAVWEAAVNAAVAEHTRRNGVTVKLICDLDIAIKAMEDINAAVARFANGIKATSSVGVQGDTGRVVRKGSSRYPSNDFRVEYAQNAFDLSVRVTHVPSGLAETCQDAACADTNKDMAMERLARRLDKIGRTDDPRWTQTV